MKKVILLLIFSFVLFGCGMNNTPTSKVEELMAKYQGLDSDIEDEIETVLSDLNLTLDQKKDYRKLLRNQYKNLTYNIKEEEIDGDSAIVSVEVEVIDYKDAITVVDDNYIGRDDYTVEEYNDDKIRELKDAREKVTYNLDIELNKDSNGEWNVLSLSNLEKKKLQGMY